MCSSQTATSEGALESRERRAGKDHLGMGGRGGAPLSLRLDPLRLSFLASLLG